MRQFHKPMPETVWNTLCLGLDTLLRTRGLEMQGPVNEVTAFFGATTTIIPEPTGEAAPAPAVEAAVAPVEAAPAPPANRRAHRAAAKPKRR